MSAVDILDQRFALSFEVFPPKTDVGMEKLCGVLERLYTLKPGAIACTYDPGGANIGKNLQVLDKLVRDGQTAAVTHFTCVGNTEAGILHQLQTYLEHGVRHLLALRGDLPAGRTDSGTLEDAAQLTALARREFGDQFTIAVSGSPEGRRGMDEEIALLKKKQDAGADYILTRPCWDMDTFRRWLDGIRAAGITLPVMAGVMPVADQAETINVALSQNGGVIPHALSELISQNWIYPNPFVKDPFDAEAEQKKTAFRSAGREFTVNQIQTYRACGIQGVCLYTQNRFEDVADIVRAADLK